MNVLRKGDWSVSHIPLSQGRLFVEQYHYGKKASNTRTYLFGLFYKDDPMLHGISWWIPPIIGAAKFVNGEKHRGVLSLSRFCLIEGRPENAGSFLISGSIKQLNRKRWPMLLTFADAALNHNGGLYKASNWLYYGLTKPRAIYHDQEGAIVSRKKGPITFNHNQMLGKGYEFKGEYPMHRFIYPLYQRKLINQLELKFNNKGQIIK